VPELVCLSVNLYLHTNTLKHHRHKKYSPTPVHRLLLSTRNDTMVMAITTKILISFSNKTFWDNLSLREARQGDEAIYA